MRVVTQLTLPIGTVEERKAMEEATAKRLNRGIVDQKRRIIYLTESVLLDLSQPLIGLEDVSVPDISLLEDCPEPLVIPEDDEDRAALLRNLEETVCGYLETSLRVLASRGNVKEKLEILDWIFAPDFLGYRSTMHEGERIKEAIWAFNYPWTYVWVCKVTGTDPTRWRDAIEAQLQDLANKGKRTFVTVAKQFESVH